MSAELERRKSQVKQIFEYMMAGNKITPKDAERMVGSMRLGARISDIKARFGVYVKSVLQWDAEKKRRWAVYSIPKEERERWLRENQDKINQ